MEYIGYLMAATPFIGLFLLIWKVSGLRIALKAYGTSILIVAWLSIAVVLISINAT